MKHLKPYEEHFNESTKVSSERYTTQFGEKGYTVRDTKTGKVVFTGKKRDGSDAKVWAYDRNNIKEQEISSYQLPATVSKLKRTRWMHNIDSEGNISLRKPYGIKNGNKTDFGEGTGVGIFSK